MNEKQQYIIKGIVIHKHDGHGIPGLKVEAWDKDLIIDDLLGAAETDKDGRFNISFSEHYYREICIDRKPDVYFRILAGKQLIRSTEDSVLWNVTKGQLTVEVSVTLKTPGEPAQVKARVKGKVTDRTDNVMPGLEVQAIRRYLRGETLLGRGKTDIRGVYEIPYAIPEAGTADLNLVLAVSDHAGELVYRTEVYYQIAPEAVINIQVPAFVAGFSFFERLARTLQPLLEEGMTFADLEQDAEHDDLVFLAGKTKIAEENIARFVLAFQLGEQQLPVEFWFLLLGSTFFRYTAHQSLKEQAAEILNSLSALDAAAVRKALNRGFNLKEIPASFQEQIDNWIEACLKLAAGHAVSDTARSEFLKSTLDHAGITDKKQQERFARLFNEQKALTPQLVQILEQDSSFQKEQIADLKTSFQLADLTRGDFSVVKMLKEQFQIRHPGKIPGLAKMSADQWINLITEKQAAGKIKLPLVSAELPGKVKIPDAEVYGRTLERQFREAFPTSAFTGGLERALTNGGARGLRHARDLGRFLNAHQDFEWLHTSLDDYFKDNVHPEFKSLVEEEGFRLEVKAVQRVFKLTPVFEATDTLLADGMHSARKIYRMGESEFVRTYEHSPGFTAESAQLTWNRAADTHAAVLSIVGDLKSLEEGSLPGVMRTGSEALSSFPNWNNLFKNGDQCECEYCRSVLSPAAYFADLLMFLKDRKAADPAYSVKDILFRRRPDLGYLELNCDNANTPLPYIDVVCEVLEDAVAKGENDLELPGFTTMPPDPVAAGAAVMAAFSEQSISPGADFTLVQVDTADPDRWVVHGDEATWLLKKKAPSSSFFAETLRNTKAGAAELRAYPQYISPVAYERLRMARYPFALPFDLFAAEVRAAFQKPNLLRWDLMGTLRSASAPCNPSPGEIAAEYFTISVDAAAAFDEKRLILDADSTGAGQQAVWGETGNAAWLDTVRNVHTFLLKTGLTYDDLPALLDLKFINPAGDIVIQHLDASCDTKQKQILGLDFEKLDRLHRFLRLWRKLPDWRMEELDLVIRHPALGNGTLNEPFLINLFYFCRLKTGIGKQATVEQLCGLFGDLNTGDSFTGLHRKRKPGLYGNLFLNRKLSRPLDEAFRIDPGTGDLPAGAIINDPDHLPVVLAALGIRESDLRLLTELTRISDGTLYVSGDLNLANLSFLWRHVWLARMLQFTVEEWKTVLKISGQDLGEFVGPQAAWEFFEKIDQIRAAGFKPDELNWLLGADRAAKAAPNEAATARFLASLRKELQQIRREYDPLQYAFLTAVPPVDVEKLIDLLGALLQEINRTGAEIRFIMATLSDEVPVETVVTGIPPGFAFPAAISSIRIRYDGTYGRLYFTGLMTETERTTLLSDPALAAVTGITAYREAIGEIFSRPRLELKFFEPVFAVPLADLPAAVDFKALPDPALVRKINYDAEQRLLRFAGIMTKEEQAALTALSAGAAYRSAVTSLAALPGTITSPDERIWLLDTDLQFPLRDTGVPVNDHLAQNLSTAIIKALAYLSHTRAAKAIVRQCSGQWELSEALTSHLLTRYAVLPETLMTHLKDSFAVTGGVIDYAALKTTFDSMHWAGRVAEICRQWKITLAELEKIRTLTAGSQLLDFLSLPLDSSGTGGDLDRFLNTSRLLRLRDRFPETGITLLEILEKLNSGAYTAAADFAAAVESMQSSWPAAEVEALTTALDIPYPAGYLLPANWERLQRVFYYLDNLHTGIATAQIFAASAMTPVHAGTIKELLRAGFGAESWLTLSAEIQDALREDKRDALAAYLLTRPMPADAPGGKWTDTNDLYAYYLLDVEMGSCQLTSRLVQASGSVQLFVQRCFMGLEPDVTVKAGGDDGDSAWRWWKWMRKYRIWEANRKVFLWPENWIEPELKKDRSSFFKDMENQLLQNEINQPNVEQAFTNYLEKLEEVARLEVAGFFQEDDADDAILHVFGRTAGGEPHLYYYRRFDYRQWTPWEKVELDIHGDYLVPAVVNRRLFLFWPVFTEVPDNTLNNRLTIPAASETEQPNIELQPAWKKLKLQMAVSEYREGKWTPKRVSVDYDESNSYNVEIVRKHYRFFPVDSSSVDGRFGIKYDGSSLGSDGINTASLSGAFEITGCHGVLEKSDLPGSFRPVIRPEAEATGIRTVFLKWRELENRDDSPQDDFTLENSLFLLSDYMQYTPVLQQTPWIFRMTPAWHLSHLDKFLLDGQLTLGKFANERQIPAGSWLPFFYNDRKRTFFILPSLKGNLSSPAPADGEESGYTRSERNYYPEIKKFFSGREDDYKGVIRNFIGRLNLASLDSGQRQALELFLHQQFPADTPPLQTAPPSYSDKQVENYMLRFFMRYVHLYLGMISLFFFRFRQFHFMNFYHPFVCDFSRLVYNPLKGIPTLMSRETQLMDSGFDFRQSYQPVPYWVVQQPASPQETDAYPDEIVDFSPAGAYSPYNWELFFHAPLMIANALSRNQRFEEAREWYHFIFNPVGTESAAAGGSPLSKYWITKPFFETTSLQYVQQRIDNILRMLAGGADVPGFSAQAKKDLEAQVLDWRRYPFEPHKIASYRTVAYQKTVVMKYLDNLIAWGDFLFRQDSMESINEATQLYILAAEILGNRPGEIPPQVKPPVESFNELEKEFDKFSNALVEVENLVPVLPGSGEAGSGQAPLPLLYFCIPRNEKLLEYWDTIADRLYKLRHCMNMEGVVRRLPLFEPPIDPGALVKAAAGGVDISSALADLNAPLPLYRFPILLQKANEVCGDVKALGSALLAALEKKDAEELGLLRQGQEIRLLNAVKAVREQQIEEARENLEGVKKSREQAEIKKNYYASREFMNGGETAALVLSGISLGLHTAGTVMDVLGGILAAVPDFDVGASGFGGSPVVKVKTGGLSFSRAVELAARALYQTSTILDKSASIAGTVASYQRRKEDWDFQKELAIKEMEQLDKSIAAAELRISIAEKELANQVIQIENARATDEFMRSKYTNLELYQWQVGQISGVYFQSYKMAYDLAKRTERCFRFELGIQDSSYINFGYWDSLKKGLLAGEKLQYDLRRLETAYLDQNRRELELTRHISLALLDPLALIMLQETGRCFVNLPEEIFDLDFPGHYFRRIKSVSLTLPCIVGPYTTVSCTLRLLTNSIRINTANGDNGYPRNTDDQGLPSSDDRFIENNTPVKAIAASNAQNDSGLFELNFRDDRYLPFEGAGVISQWSLELFSDLPANNPDPGNPDFGRPLRQFDYSTISDIILHIKYTAREDSGVFKNSVITYLRDYFSQDGTSHSLRMFNLRQEFPNEWYAFLHPADPAEGNIFQLNMSPQFMPLLARGKTLKINNIWLLARCTDPGSYNVVLSPPLPAGTDTLLLTPVTRFGGLHYGQKEVAALGLEIVPADPPVMWQLHMTRPDGGNLQDDPVKKTMEVEDMLLVLGYEWE